MNPNEDPALLRGCIRDLASISALPLLWIGQNARQVLIGVVDVLFTCLRLDLTYARINDPEEGSIIEAERLEGRKTECPAKDLGPVLGELFRTTKHLISPHPLGTIKIAVSHLDGVPEHGAIVAGSRRTDFPTDTERILINAVVNQATIWLRSARVAAEHRRAEATLAEEARQRQALETHAAALALLDQSLASLTSSGTLSDLFDRISVVTKPVLPHDALALPVLLPDGRHARRYASSGLDISLPDIIEVPSEYLNDPEWKYDLIDDLTQRPEPHNALAAKLGFRSALRLPVRLEGRFVGGLAFLSRTPSQYKQSDLEAARRIAGRIVLCLERGHVLEATKRADEANARAAQLESRVRQLTDELDARTGYRRVIGESAPWREVLKRAAQVAALETTVLLLGESGTGKEVVARFVHRGSARRDRPFVALNCAALPDNLLESELFGHERGAFTGAMQAKPGLIEQAAGGVLFLDEVGEMALPAQAKFLRVLQEREFQRLGGTRVLKADVRVVAATNRDLRKAIEERLFREDLFFRLNVFELRLPPLRERLDDILPLSEAFLLEIGRSIGRPPAGISREASRALAEYHWPGNVRELRNVLERAAILADGGLIVAEHLALGPHTVSRSTAVPVAQNDFPAPAAPSDLESAERAMIEKALQHARFNKSVAAKALGLTRAQLYTRLKRHGLE
jgi:transcriptional regulator with GAF, ATPase, and Fis domain